MSATVRPPCATSADHANARAPAVASVRSTARRSSRRAARSWYGSLRSRSARMPPSRAPATVGGSRGAMPPSTSAIELFHRPDDPVAQSHLDGLRRTRDRGLRRLPLVGRERREDVLDELADLRGRIRRRDADAQAREPFADDTHDRAHPVVRARTAALADADLPER